jgi:hypothetical protein
MNIQVKIMPIQVKIMPILQPWLLEQSISVEMRGYFRRTYIVARLPFETLILHGVTHQKPGFIVLKYHKIITLLF